MNKPRRFFWEELEPPQYQDVPVMLANYGPPDPYWMPPEYEGEDEDAELMDWELFEEYKDVPRWRNKIAATDECGEIIYKQERVKGYVRADPDSPRYADAPYEEMVIPSTFSYSRLTS